MNDNLKNQLPTFEQIPTLLNDLRDEIHDLKTIVDNSEVHIPEKDEKPIFIKEASLLAGLTVPTIYTKCSKNSIPHYKKDKKLYFFQSELIAWIREGKQLTHAEIENISLQYLKADI